MKFSLLLGIMFAEFDCDGSDLNRDGMVNTGDLTIFSTHYLELNWETVGWCAFISKALSVVLRIHIMGSLTYSCNS